jgi:hypothetical protein
MLHLRTLVTRARSQVVAPLSPSRGDRAAGPLLAPPPPSYRTWTAPSTVHRILVRNGLRRPHALDRMTGESVRHGDYVVRLGVTPMGHRPKATGEPTPSANCMEPESPAERPLGPRCAVLTISYLIGVVPCEIKESEHS